MEIHQGFDSLFKELEISVSEVLTVQLADNIIEVWTEHLWSDFYRAVPEGDSYTRTYELLASLSVLNVTKSGSGQIYLSIGYDPSKMSIKQNGMWTQHKDRDKLGEMVEYGLDGGIRNHSPEGTRTIEDVLAYVNSKAFIDRFNNIMKSKGYV